MRVGLILEHIKCVTWNKSFLFALNLKTLKNKEKTIILVEQAKFPNLLEMKNTNLFKHEIEM